MKYDLVKNKNGFNYYYERIGRGEFILKKVTFDIDERFKNELAVLRGEEH